jgi:uncharacterized protein (DUF2336 family)
MDLSFLDKSSQVTPLLVRLYDSHKLYGLAKDKKPLARAELTSAVSELLEMSLSPRESELIADVLIGLMRQAEMELRQALAERLSIMDNVPLRLILQIANDEINVAGSVLRNSPVLGDLDLIYIIKAKGADYWRAIAARKSISNHVMNVLAETRDFDTAMALVQNNNITLTNHVLVALSDLAQQHDVLATPLAYREEMTSEIAARLYKFAGDELKKYITENFTISASEIERTIDDIVLDLVDSGSASEFEPSNALLKAADRYKEKGLLTVQMMIGTLRRGQISSFVAQFSRFSGLSPKTIEDVLTQPNGQGLAVACKAFNIVKSDFVSIYLLTSRVRTRGKMVDVQDMTKAVEYFNRIKPEIAQGIMRNSLAKITE